jgi:YD repeat-containing protein
METVGILPRARRLAGDPQRATHHIGFGEITWLTPISNLQSPIPSYDFDGNMTSGPLPISPAANTTLAWDAENRLISSTVGTASTTYQYDAQSRRIAKVASASAPPPSTSTTPGTASQTMKGAQASRLFLLLRKPASGAPTSVVRCKALAALVNSCMNPKPRIP